MKHFLARYLQENDHPNQVFLSGDLGYQCFEGLRHQMTARFMNAGIAEGNMINVAAGLHRSGMKPWTYTIAPFCYARTFENIRNNLCHTSEGVCMVGNGGGYAYGNMGPSHHALEDYGILQTLPNLSVFVPVFNHDIAAIATRMQNLKHPSYLRLGRQESIEDPPPYADWRQLLQGDATPILAIGPIAGKLMDFCADHDTRPSLWTSSCFPLKKNDIPKAFIDEVKTTQRLIIVEEHVRHGSIASDLALMFLEWGIGLQFFRHFCAKGYRDHHYGSQDYHRQCDGLTVEEIVRTSLLPGHLNDI